jgi:UDP-N-acetylglucosamine 2-epimerase (non-hydrolysing)
VHRVMVIAGTRPEAIKLAPVLRSLEQSETLIPVLVVTSQHRDLLHEVFRLFRITPRFDLKLKRNSSSLTELMGSILTGLAPIIASELPRLMVVQGDTTSALAGALAGYYNGVDVAHVEAGLRTHDRYAPFPEEGNRTAITHLSSLHFAPTATNRENLLAENIPDSAIVVTGNTVVDALQWALRRQAKFQQPELADLDTDVRPVLLVTAHRRESWGTSMASIGRALARLAKVERDLIIVFPIHPNPIVRDAILPLVRMYENVRVIDPLPYGEFVRLMHRAAIILTDSGGIQEEAPSLGTPVLVMRDLTERPEAVQVRSVALVGTATDGIVGAVTDLLHNEEKAHRMSQVTNPYGDGRAAERTTAAIAQYLSNRLLDFPPSFVDRTLGS